MASFLAISRERVYSPGKVDADRAILLEVVARLTREHHAEVVSAEDPLPEPDSQTVVLAMGQGPSVLDTMRRWQRAGVRIVNTPDAIENCHRHRMLPILQQACVQHPSTVIVSTDDGAGLPEWLASGAWLKRGDVHATEAGDVVRVRSASEVQSVLRNFGQRGITHAAVQQDVAGVVIKFYAVRGTFFAWFPEAELTLQDHEVERMRELAEKGAAALGLEVYGGDLVRDGKGAFWLIDMNDWPSYGRCRLQAAEAIASYLIRNALRKNEAAAERRTRS